MKVHLQQPALVEAGYRDIAYASWEREGLVPGVVKSCTQLMVSTKNASMLTLDIAAVTCKHCIKVINSKMSIKCK